MSDWSKTIGTDLGAALRARMIIVQARSPASDGPGRETALYLEIQNRTRYVGNPMKVYFDPEKGLDCQLFDANGKPPPQPQARALSGSGPGACWITLPYDSSIRLRCSWYAAGRQKGDGLDLILANGLSASWTIEPGDTNVYYLSGTFTIRPPPNYVPKNFDERKTIWDGKLELPKMTISVSKP